MQAFLTVGAMINRHVKTAPYDVSQSSVVRNALESMRAQLDKARDPATRVILLR